MKSNATTIDGYLAGLPEDRRATINGLRKIILKHLPKGYEEVLQYGVIAYVVPLKAYPAGYLNRKNEALPYAGIAAQKNYTSLYIMCLYGSKEADAWFRKAFKDAGKKLDMGKSCVRFKKLDDLPLDVIGQAIARVPMKKYIEICESARKKS